MTREEFNKTIDRNFKPEEIALINFNIYFNPDHIEYYTSYKRGMYQWCYDYLVENRELLSIKHTPMGHRTNAKATIKAAKALYKNKRNVYDEGLDNIKGHLWEREKKLKSGTPAEQNLKRINKRRNKRK